MTIMVFRHRLRMVKTLYRFPEDENGNDHQGDSVNEGGEWLNATSQRCGGYLAAGWRSAHRQQSEQEGGGVGEHMSGIGEQGQGTGNDAADGLNNHKTGGYDKSPKAAGWRYCFRQQGSVNVHAP